MFADDLPSDHRSGFVALAGKPNVGKSTLMNAWLGSRLAPVSPKPQTTRQVLLGILTRPDAQVVFVDTPGIHRPHSKLGSYMVESAKRAIPDADVVLFMADGSRPPSRGDREVASLLQGLDMPVILALNKADLIPESERAAALAAYAALGGFDARLALSALTGENLAALLDLVLERLPLGPRFYPEDQLTDQYERFIAAELIREQAMRHLEQEVPHALAVAVQEYKERRSGLVYIEANLYTEKESQKGIVVGRKGAMLKRIGRDARVALEEFLGRKVYLELWVKVRKNWRHDDRYLDELGYSLQQ
jgi:GTP-binding protein Era